VRRLREYLGKKGREHQSGRALSAVPISA
jgi:hypothetical protein